MTEERRQAAQRVLDDCVQWRFPRRWRMSRAEMALWVLRRGDGVEPIAEMRDEAKGRPGHKALAQAVVKSHEYGSVAQHQAHDRDVST